MRWQGFAAADRTKCAWPLAINLAYLAFIAMIPFTSEVLGNYSEDSMGVALYAANLTAVSLISWASLFMLGDRVVDRLTGISKPR